MQDDSKDNLMIRIRIKSSCLWWNLDDLWIGERPQQQNDLNPTVSDGMVS